MFDMLEEAMWEMGSIALNVYAWGDGDDAQQQIEQL